MVALSATAINLDAVKAKRVKVLNVTGIIHLLLLVFAALATVEIPSSREAERVNLLNHRLRVRKGLVVDEWKAGAVVLPHAGRRVDAAAILPTLVNADRAVANVAERRVVVEAGASLALVAPSNKARKRPLMIDCYS